MPTYSFFDRLGYLSRFACYFSNAMAFSRNFLVQCYFVWPEMRVITVCDYEELARKMLGMERSSSLLDDDTSLFSYFTE